MKYSIEITKEHPLKWCAAIIGGPQDGANFYYSSRHQAIKAALHFQWVNDLLYRVVIYKDN